MCADVCEGGGAALRTMATPCAQRPKCKHVLAWEIGGALGLVPAVPVSDNEVAQVCVCAGHYDVMCGRRFDAFM